MKGWVTRPEAPRRDSLQILDLYWEKSPWGPHESPHGPYSDLSEDVGSWCWALRGVTATGTSTSEEWSVTGAGRVESSWGSLHLYPLSYHAVCRKWPEWSFFPPTPRLLAEFLIGFIETEPPSKRVWESIIRKPWPHGTAYRRVGLETRDNK